MPLTIWPSSGRSFARPNRRRAAPQEVRKDRDCELCQNRNLRIILLTFRTVRQKAA